MTVVFFRSEVACDVASLALLLFGLGILAAAARPHAGPVIVPSLQEGIGEQKTASRAALHI